MLPLSGRVRADQELNSAAQFAGGRAISSRLDRAEWPATSYVTTVTPMWIGSPSSSPVGSPLPHVSVVASVASVSKC